MTTTRRVRALASLLLRYPDEELVGRVADLASAVESLPRQQREPLRTFLGHLASVPLLDLQREYVATFDLKRRCCLYLSYYLNGDTRRRGMALVGFQDVYRSAGLAVAASELPDYLPVVLEFAVDGDERLGQDLLVAHRRGLEVLRRALAELGSPYADVVDLVVDTLPSASSSDLDAAVLLAVQGPPAELVGLAPFGPAETVGLGVRS